MQLVERDDELGRLTELLVAAQQGNGSVVLVRGEAGVGKTALVQRFLDDIGNRAHLLWGACEDIVTAVPFAPLWDMAASDAELHSVISAGDRVRTLRTVLDRMSRTLRPTVVVVEDAQWADEATLALIRVLGRRASKSHGLLIVTFRDDHFAIEHPLRRVVGAIPPGSLERIQLGPLSREGVADLVGPGLDVDEIMRLTRGNPFFVSEIVRHPGDEIPLSVADAVGFQMSTLSRRSRQVVELVSVIPGNAEIDLIARITPDAEAAIAESEGIGLVEVDGERVAFRHELARLAIEKSLSTIDRRRLNRSVFEALEASNGEAGRCAHHAHQAGDAAALLRLVPVAARRAADVGSSREAVRLLRLIDPHLGELNPDELADHYDLLVGQAMLGDEPGLVEIAELAVGLRRALGDPASLGSTLLMAGEAAFVEGQPVKARNLTDEALVVLGPVGGELLALAHARRARLAIRAGEYGSGVEHARTGVELSTGSSSRSRVQALLNLGTALGETRFPDGLEELFEAHRLSGELGFVDEQAKAAGTISILYWRHRDVEAAEAWIHLGLESISEADLPVLEDWLRIGLAFAAEARGEWNAAIAQATEIYGAANRRDHLVTSGILLAKVHTRRGSPDAGRLLDEVSVIASQKGDHALMAFIAAVAVEKAWLQDDRESRPVDEAVALWHQISEVEPPWIWGELSMWLRIAGRLDRDDQSLPSPWRTLIGDDWETAADLWRDRGMPYERALALYSGNTAARLEALRLLDGLEAVPLAAKLRRGLRAEGVKGIPRGPYSGRRADPLGLTPRQAEILELVAESLSNSEIADRLFLSVRTVEQHVSSILATLSARNRRDAVRIASDSSLVSTTRSPGLDGSARNLRGSTNTHHLSER